MSDDFLAQGRWLMPRPRRAENTPTLRPLHPGLPAGEEPAQVLGVHGLLDEEVDLPPDAEHRALLHPLQLLLQPQQNPLGHLVEALAVAAEGGRQRGDSEETATGRQCLRSDRKAAYPDRRWLTMSSLPPPPPMVELSVALSSCCSSCCRWKAFSGFMVQSNSGS